MSGPAGQPRHARAEIRAFAKWLRDRGWIYETNDSSGHTIWSHPRATGRYKLPETPKSFNVRRARRDVARLLGEQVAGKRSGKPKADKAPRRDFTLQAAQKAAADRDAERVAQERAAAQQAARRAEQIRAARARQRAAADTAYADYQRERFYADLMRPGTSR